MTMVAALAAMATSFINPSAVSSWLSSIRRPWVFIDRKNCSMIQRRLYQATICQASATLATSWVVSRSQWMGFAPLGGCCSMTSTKLSATLAGKSLSLVVFGPRRTVHAFGHVNHRLGGKRHALDRLAQRSALDQRMVVHHPRQMVHTRPRR